MKFYLHPCYIHHMNKIGIDLIINYLNWEYTNSINDADVIYSPSAYLNTENYPNKKFIFGPHFSVFPNQESRMISNKHNNSVYIQPSEPSVNTWVNEFLFNNIPVKSFPFPIDIDNVKISELPKTEVVVYYKQRNPNDLKIVTDFLDSKSVKYILIKYGQYVESEFQNILDKTKYVIWVGRHESQGFALESALVKNIPILVWSTKLRHQEYNCPPEYYDVKSEVTTVPYWDDNCGVVFYEKEDLEKSYEKFINNLNTYSPKNYIEQVVSVKTCSENLIKLINK